MSYEDQVHFSIKSFFSLVKTSENDLSRNRYLTNYHQLLRRYERMLQNDLKISCIQFNDCPEINQCNFF